MMQENAQNRRRLKKKESLRISTFVEQAYKQDPRHKRIQAEVKAAKEKAKQEKVGYSMEPYLSVQVQVEDSGV